MATYSLSVLIAEYLEYLEIQSIRPLTVRNYRTTLNVFYKWAAEEAQDFPLNDLSKVTRKQIREYFRHRKIEQQVGNGTLKQNYIHLNRFFKWIRKEYKIPKKNPMKGIDKPEYTPPLIEFPEVAIIEKMIASCDTSFSGMRDRALLLLFRDTGGRATEILKLTEQDIDIAEQSIHIHYGKGGKRREVPYSDETSIAIATYQIARKDHPYSELPRFFLGQQGTFGYGGLRNMFYARSLMVSDTRLSPHKFRHAFVHQAKVRSISEDALLELCGWSTRAMLDHYGRSMRRERANDEYRAKMLNSKEG